MALFKIFKGNSSTLPKNYKDGYCYFTIDDGKMYIDTKDSDSTGRILLNAGHADTAANVAWSGVTNKPSYYDAKAIKGITRSGTTFTYTCMDGTTGTFTQQDNNTTYGAATSSAAGLMSAADKAKLDKIAAGATANVGTITGVTAGKGLTGGGTSGAVTLNIGAGTGISVTDDAISLSTSGAAAGTYGPSANVSGSNGATINVPQITVDAYGRVTSVTNKTYTSVNTDTNNKVAQNKTTTSYWRPLLSHMGYGYYNVDPGDQTGTVCYHESIAMQPSSGTLRATTFTGNLSGNASSASLLKPTDNINKITYGISGWGANVAANNGHIVWREKFTHSDLGSDTGDIILWVNNATSLNMTIDGDYYAKGNKLVLHTGNYNSYAPTLTGGGASGTWPISITGNAATATKATQDGSGNTITSKYVTVDTAQTISGAKTFTNKVILQNTDDTDVATANSGILLIGTPTGEHISIDGNEIMAKSTSTKAGTLNLQVNNGGSTYIGGTLIVAGDASFSGNIAPSANNYKTLGTSSYKWNNVYATTFTGNLSGKSSGAISVAEIYDSTTQKKDIQAYCNTNSNIHKLSNYGHSGEVNFARFFAQDEAASNYNLPCVDSHTHIYSIDNANSWIRLLSLDIRTNDIWTRSKTNGTWNNWVKLLDSSNYTSYAPTKTGGGASGTWGISISGNAATATQLSSNSRMDYGWNGVNYFNFNGTKGNAAKANDAPTSAWWHILRFNHANNSGYYTDLAIPFNANSLYYKRISGGSVTNGGWVKVLDTLNYTDYTVTKTGTGASGTWGINVTGYAGSLRSVFAVDTSRYNQPITWFRANGTTEHAYIGAHNTGNSKGSIIIQPAYSSGDKWATNQGLYVGASELRFNNNFVLHSANYSSYALPKAGGTLTGSLNLKVSGIDLTHATNNCTSTQYPTTFNILDQNERTINRLETVLTANSGNVATYWYVRNYDSSGNVVGQKGIRMTIDKSGTLSTTISDTVTVGKLYGAVWNDYAEYRSCKEKFKPGQVVYENGDDTLSISNSRLQRGCSIVSDTFGFAIGETDEAKCPIAVSGRVLAHGYEPREEFKKHIGWPVCSGPNGTVSIMTEEEEEKYPSRIIGTISAIPDYEEWGTENIKVDNRIWIKVK